MNIFDFHTHAYPERIAIKSVQHLNTYYGVHCAGTGTMGDLLDSARDGGVGYLLVHAVATKAHQVEKVNTWIAAHLSKNVFGFGTIHPEYPHILREIERIRSLGLLGIKIHPDFQHFNADDPSMDIVYSTIEGKMPVLIHCGDQKTDYSSPYRIANIIDRYPRLTVIAAHFGGYTEWEDAERCVIGKNCYIDTSSSLWALKPETAARMIREHGVNRVLFGTDYPLTRHREELERFSALPLTDEEKRMILFENAKRLLKLDI